MRKAAATAMMALAAGLGLGLSGPSSASAATVYSYVVQPQGGAITPGTDNTLNLYLQEVATSGSFQASNTTANGGGGGLFSAGVSLIEQAGGTGVTFTQAGLVNNNAAEPTGFTGNDTSGLMTNGGAWLSDITGNSASKGVAPVSSVTSGGTTTSLYFLGSMTVGVANNANAAFKVTSFANTPTGQGNPGAGVDGNTLTFNSPNYDLDAATGGPPGSVGADATQTPFTINAASPVPEPASMALFGLGAVGLLARRRRSA